MWAVILHHTGSAGMLAGDNREWESSDQLDYEYICTKSLEKKPYRLDREQQCPFIIRKYKSTRKKMDLREMAMHLSSSPLDQASHMKIKEDRGYQGASKVQWV